MRIQQRQSLILIDRMLLQIEARGINVRPDDVHARFQRFAADHE